MKTLKLIGRVAEVVTITALSLMLLAMPVVIAISFHQQGII